MALGIIFLFLFIYANMDTILLTRNGDQTVITKNDKSIKIDTKDLLLILNSTISISNSYYDPNPKEEKDLFFEDKFDRSVSDENTINHVEMDLIGIGDLVSGSELDDNIRFDQINRYVQIHRTDLISGSGKQLYLYLKKENDKIKAILSKMFDYNELRFFGESDDDRWIYDLLSQLLEMKDLNMKWKELKLKDNAFYVSLFETTQFEWFSVMGYNKSHFRFPKYCRESHYEIQGFHICPYHPVENISFEEVLVFLKRLNSFDKNYLYRLPRENEWKYIANKKKAKVDFSPSNPLKNLDDYAWYSHNSSERTHAVGTKKANSLGLHDLFGNVWEMLHHDSPKESSRLKIMGGYWHAPPWFLKSEYNQENDLYAKADDMGFRLVRVRK